MNHYDRDYYLSNDGLVRVTLDYNQAFYDQRLSPFPNLYRANASPDTLTLELKCAPSAYDRLLECVEKFPLRVAKNSKYVNGILQSI